MFFFFLRLRHADTTWRDIVREDNSTNHVAAYDIDSGAFLETGAKAVLAGGSGRR